MAVAIAIWLLVAPFILGYPPAAAVLSISVGVVTLAMVPLGKDAPSKFGAGWKTLLNPART